MPTENKTAVREGQRRKSGNCNDRCVGQQERGGRRKKAQEKLFPRKGAVGQKRITDADAREYHIKAGGGRVLKEGREKDATGGGRQWSVGVLWQSNYVPATGKKSVPVEEGNRKARTMKKGQHPERKPKLPVFRW